MLNGPPARTFVSPKYESAALLRMSVPGPCLVRPPGPEIWPAMTPVVNVAGLPFGLTLITLSDWSTTGLSKLVDATLKLPSENRRAPSGLLLPAAFPGPLRLSTAPGPRLQLKLFGFGPLSASFNWPPEFTVIP